MVRGIDNQMMITRAADLTRDASQLQRQHEISQDFQAAHTQALAEQEKKRVAHSEEIEETYIREKEDEEQRGSAQEQKQQAAEEQAAADDAYMPTSLGHHTIDIKI